jgi:2-polyprenyl-3-methyl-5-hydroxy-6-metoxy-1,4-benzoquinol methylase
MTSTAITRNAPLRILVAVASYGTRNDRHLSQILQEYQSMSFEVHIVVLSNIRKPLAPSIEVVVGLPNKNPWSLPFLHKNIFAERLECYDIFLYTEDDILITESNIWSFLAVSSQLHEDEIAGFIRIEAGPDGTVNYPDVQFNFHWDINSVKVRGEYTLAHFTNEHAACYLLTQSQLRLAIKSGGFLVEPHEWKYDLLCSAATDPYTQCGFLKLIPISHLSEFTVHHLSDKYVGKLGISEVQFQSQISELLQIGGTARSQKQLLDTETKLKGGLFSKSYYEPVNKEVLSAIPKEAQSVLSIGCGSGEMECLLSEGGRRVVAVPLDRVICQGAANRGVELILGDFYEAQTKLLGQRFDCLLFVNLLHLVQNPCEVLSLFTELLHADSLVVIHSTNMLSLQEILHSVQAVNRFHDLGNYNRAGMHVTSAGKVDRWCRNSGLNITRTIWTYPERARTIYRLVPNFMKPFVACEFTKVATFPRRRFNSSSYSTKDSSQRDGQTGPAHEISDSPVRSVVTR